MVQNLLELVDYTFEKRRFNFDGFDQDDINTSRKTLLNSNSFIHSRIEFDKTIKL